MRQYLSVNRAWLLGLVVLFLLGTIVLPGRAKNTSTKPNVLVILTDDQGWGDLGISGNSNLATPEIDALARGGASFDAFYVCAVCAPTRAEFLTGRYHPRTGVSGVSTGEERMNSDESTLADLFKAGGYVTGAFGKWHNGTQPPYHPCNRGFDEFYGFTSGHWSHYFDVPMDHNGERVRGKAFIVDDLTDRAMDFMEKNRDRPFFCYVPYNTPHSPMMVPDRFYKKFAKKKFDQTHRDPELEDVQMTRAALALCENIDWNVGRLLGKLEELELAKDTIVLYFSDNGPNSYRWNGGLKGRKGSVDEGGIRSPLFVRWPKKIPAGKSIAEVVGAIDLLPTLAEFTGLERVGDKPLDGQSFASLLFSSGEDWQPRPLFSTWRKKASVREGAFRYDRTGALYNLESDRGQEVNVAEVFPERAQYLREKLDAHVAEMTQALGDAAQRPFPVGFGPRTQLPARDAIPHGGITRSSKAPNNSFMENWTRADQFITWDVEVVHAGQYEATIYYTCAVAHSGMTVHLNGGGAATQAQLIHFFDPPLYDKRLERVESSHYVMKDFKPTSLGTISLPKGRTLLKLSVSDLQGEGAIDVYAVDLERKSAPVN
jgi:arylsulfatase A-like enzyme